MALGVGDSSGGGSFDGALLAAIMDSSGEAIIGLGSDGVIEAWNRGAEQLYGYVAEEARGRSVAILNLPGAEDLVERVTAAACGVTSHVEAEHRGRDGGRLEVEVTVAPVRDAAGAVIGAWCAARALSEPKRAERELARLADAAALSTDAIISLDLDARVRHWSPGAERLFGFAAEDVIGLRMDELGALSGEPDQASASWRDLIPRVLGTGVALGHEFQCRREDGTVVDVLGRIIPWRVVGRAVGVTGLLIDISERKHAERELARLADAADYGSDAVVSTDLDGRVRHWNRGAERIYGFSADDAIGKTVEELNALGGESEQANARAREAIARMLGGEPAYRQEAQRRRADGTIIDLLITFTPWRVDGRVAGVTTTSVDVSERNRVERATARLAAIVESSDDAIIGETPDGQITSWNGAAERIYGYSAAEAVGNHISILVSTRTGGRAQRAAGPRRHR